MAQLKSLNMMHLRGTNLDHLTLLRLIYQVGEEGYLKGPGFFAFTKGMPVMLQ